MRNTEKGKSYWNKNGAYQTEYNELYSKLVPDSGEADTIQGELIRSASRLTYDYYNNGNCNVVEPECERCEECDGAGLVEEECSSCCGDGEIHTSDGDEDYYETCDDCGGDGFTHEECYYCDGHGNVESTYKINDYYQDMVDFLREHLTNKVVVTNLEEFLMRGDLGYGEYTFDEEESSVYTTLMDTVMYEVLKMGNN